MLNLRDVTELQAHMMVMEKIDKDKKVNQAL